MEAEWAGVAIICAGVGGFLLAWFIAWYLGYHYGFIDGQKENKGGENP
jgi:hypothetical protein